MSEWKQSFYTGQPKKDGIYLVKANDIVNQWEEKLNFKGGEWHMLCGNLFPAIADEWCELPED